MLKERKFLPKKKAEKKNLGFKQEVEARLNIARQTNDG